MANTEMNCPKCGARMEEGFVPDYSYGQVLLGAWVKGRPERGWLGVKMRGKTKVPITTYRCTSCGYLDAYAT